MSTARLLLSVAELANRPGVRWLVDRKVQRGEISLLYADRGAGKSLFALAMALHVATGTPFLGRPVERGPVIYIALENTAALHAPIQAWLEAHGMKAADLDGWFHVWNERKLRLQARDSEHVTALRETLQAMDTAPALIIIDTWARYTTGLKEKEESDMGLAIHTLDELRDQVGASFLIVHHSGKDSSKGARGSSALEAAATTVLHLKPGSGDQITVRCEKQNNGPDGWKHVLTLRQCQEVESVALIDPESRLEDADASTGQDRNDGLDNVEQAVLSHIGERQQVTFNALKKGLRGMGNQVKHDAVERLVGQGRLVRVPGPRGAQYLRVVPTVEERPGTADGSQDRSATGPVVQQAAA